MAKVKKVKRSAAKKLKPKQKKPLISSIRELAMADLNKLPDVLTTLSIKIDKKWKVYDFITVFDCINKLYAIINLEMTEISLQKAFVLDKRLRNTAFIKRVDFILSSHEIYMPSGTPWSESHWDKLESTLQLYSLNYLQVKEIKFSSPGNIDILGVGKVLHEVFQILKYYLPNKNDKLKIKMKEVEIKHKEEELKMKEQEHLKMQIDNLSSLGFSKTEINTHLSNKMKLAKRIIKKKDSGQITNIEIIDPE